jgi:hypothetical protein
VSAGVGCGCGALGLDAAAASSIDALLGAVQPAVRDALARRRRRDLD